MQILNTFKKNPKMFAEELVINKKKERHANFLKKLAFLNG